MNPTLRWHDFGSAPDGYTLFGISTIHAINPSLYRKLTYDPVKDFAPITNVAATSQILTVHPSLPVPSVKAFIAYANSKPGELNYSSAGNGSQPHLTGELFKTMTGVNLVHVPYKGAPPAMTDLLAGQVALTFATAPSAVPHVRSGKLRALGVSTATRIKALPDVPTIAEAGVAGFEVAGWNSLVAPAGVPAAIIERLHGAIVKKRHTPFTCSSRDSIGQSECELSTQTSQSRPAFGHKTGWAASAWQSSLRLDAGELQRRFPDCKLVLHIGRKRLWRG